MPEIAQVEANIHYYERGEGSNVILMLHGPGQSLYTYRNNLTPSAEGGLQGTDS